MSKDLHEFITTESDADVMSVLSGSMFSESLSRNLSSDGKYFFRVRDKRRTIGRSRDFESAAERDDAFSQFIDWIEVTIHGNFQRSFDFAASPQPGIT